MKQFTLFSALAAVILPVSASASDFIDTNPAEDLFNFGIRLGANSSVHTLNKDYFQAYNVNSWGVGLDFGAVFNINFREYLSLQPGLFIQSRSGHYSYIDVYTVDEETESFVQLGNYRGLCFNIPVMASFRFSLAENVKWLVEAGPYLQISVPYSDSGDINVIVPPVIDNYVSSVPAKTNSFDFGFKFGTGILAADHYSFSIHYMAGCRNAWKQPFDGGRNKAWTFTIGYDF